MTTRFDPNGLNLLTMAQHCASDETARAFFEAWRWPNGPVCPHCANAEQATIGKIAANGTTIRAGLYQCGACRGQFTVTVNTVMEDSHVPLHKWLWAFYRMASSKTQVAALQIQRELALGSYRTAWFMCHRIRFAMEETTPGDKLRGTVEADETYMGGVRRGQGRGTKGKLPVVSLVERGGRVRSMVTPIVNKDTVGVLLAQNVDKSAVLNTDESRVYPEAASYFAAHDTVNHSQEEYGRHDKVTGRLATTNAVEGFFGNSKRSIDGTHHHISPQYTSLYFAELDFKYNARKVSDGARTVAAIATVEGKRLTLRPMKTPARPGQLPAVALAVVGPKKEVA